MLNLQDKYRPAANVSQEDIEGLIDDLGSQQGLVCKKARTELVAIGEPAVGPLIDAFQHRRDGQLHWEAAKALSQIGSPRATETFIEALQDDDAGVRWLAAEGLIAIGQPAIKPLLQTLEHHPGANRLRAGAHHILHDLSHRQLVEPPIKYQLSLVLRALDDIEPALEVPIAARKALHVIDS